MLFAGDDWAEDHHDVELQDVAGRVLARARLPEGITGITRLHALVGQFAGPDADLGQVAIGIETDRGLWVTALRAAGYAVYAINPRQAARYRERHGTSGAKGDKADAHTLADMVALGRDQEGSEAADEAGQGSHLGACVLDPGQRLLLAAGEPTRPGEHEPGGPAGRQVRAVAVGPTLADVAGQEAGAAGVAALADLAHQLTDRDPGLLRPPLAEVEYAA